MKSNTEKAGKAKHPRSFAVAAFVLGLMALVVSVIPCLGMYALIPGLLAIVFGIIALCRCSGVAEAPRGLVVAALIISLLGTSIGTWQLIIIVRSTSRFEQVGFDINDIFRRDTTGQIEDLLKEEEEEREKEIEELLRRLEEKEKDTINVL